MENIGRYEGKECWTCTKEEWLELKDRTGDGVIYIIGQDMVCANSIIGNYNGHRVDRYQEPYAIYHFERGKEQRLNRQEILILKNIQKWQMISLRIWKNGRKIKHI